MGRAFAGLPQSNTFWKSKNSRQLHSKLKVRKNRNAVRAQGGGETGTN